MRKTLSLLFSGLSVFSVQAQSDPALFLVKPLSGQSFQQAEVETSGGNIALSGTTAGDARVEVYISTNDGHNTVLPKAETQKRLDEKYVFSIEVSNNKLSVIARPKQGIQLFSRRELNISFKVFVPQSVSTVLKTSGGNIALSNMSGATQEIKTSGGNLEVDHVSGKLLGKTSGGNISIEQAKDDIDLSTSGGNIEARSCQGNIRLGTSGGNVDMHDLRGVIRANTSGGSVEGERIGGELRTGTSGGNISLTGLSCSLTASNSGGSIDVQVDALGKYVTLTNSGGDIHLQLPKDKGVNLDVSGNQVARGATLSNFVGDVDEKHINGTLNGGGIPVKVRGSGGRVSLSFR